MESKTGFFDVAQLNSVRCQLQYLGYFEKPLLFKLRSLTILDRWQLKHFWNFHPENWGNDTI